MTGTPTIFGTPARSDAAPSRHSESTYAFLCRAAGSVWDQYRALIDAWLLEYPATGRDAMISRLKTGNNRDFTSAFWELYLHEMYRSVGWAIEIEPDVPGATTRPDFLVSKDGISYYVEARCTFEADNDLGATARLQTVYDTLNDINSGAFRLAVTPARIGSQAPATKELRAGLEKWLAQLDPDAGDYTLNDTRPERRYEWTSRDWHLIFHPIPREAASRSVPARRPLSLFIPTEASFIDDISPLKNALRDKGSKYGVLPHPLVIAINIGSGFHDEDDTEQALYGTVGFQINLNDADAVATPVLTEPGYWGWPGSPAHTNVSGVLLVEGFHYGQVARLAPTFWPHPSAAQPVPTLPVWRITSATAEGMKYSEPGTPPQVHFNLPEGWPIGERFPRGNA